MHRWLLLCTVTLAVALGGFACRQAPRAENAGDSLAARLAQRQALRLARDLDSVDTTTCVRAAAAIGSLGSDAGPAVPYLIAALDDGSSRIRIAAVECLDRLGPRTAPTAAEAIENSLAAGRVPTTYTVRAAVALAHLTRRPEQAFGPLRAALRAEDDEVRIAAIRAGAEFGTGASSLAPAIRELAANDPSEIVRLHARLALASLETVHDVLEDQFLEALHSDNAVERRLAARGLGVCGALDDEQRSALRARLEEDVADVRQAAAMALATDTGAGRLILTKLLESDRAGVREHATRGLGSMGPAARPAAARIVPLLRDASTPVRAAAAEALGRIGPADAMSIELANFLAGSGGDLPETRDALVACGVDAVAPLDELLASEDASTARTAAALLVRIGPRALRSLPSGGAGGPSRQAILRAQVHAMLAGDASEELRRIALFLDSHVAATREAAARSLGMFEEWARLHLPRLEALLDDPDAHVRTVAAESIGRIASRDGGAVKALVARLSLDTGEPRRAALGALAHLGPWAESAVGELIRVLRDGDEREAALAATALAAIGPAALPALDDLVAALDLDEPVRIEAARALGRIGPAAVAAVDALIEQTKDADIHARRAAYEALAGIAADREAVRLALVEGARDTDPRARRQAARAILSIGRAYGREDWIAPLVHHDDPRIAARAARELDEVERRRARADAA